MHTLTLLMLAQAPLGDLDSKDPAVARRAFEIAIEFGDEQALAAAARNSEQARLAIAEIRAHKRFGDCYPAVPLVTLITNPSTRAAVLAEAEELTGLRFMKGDSEVGGEGNAVAPISLSRVYPLEAVDEVMLAINGRAWIRHRTVRYFSGPGQRLSHQAYWRHFAFHASNFTIRRTLDPLGVSESVAILHLNFRHDGLCRLAGNRSPRSVEVFAGDDKPLAAEPMENAAGEAASELTMVEQSLSPLRISVKNLPAGCRTLTLVRGRLPLLIPEKRSWRELPLYGDRKELALDNVRISLKEVFDDGGQVRVMATVDDPAKRHIRPDVGDFQLLGQDGAKVPARGLRHWRGSEMDFVLTFDNPASFIPSALRVAVYESLGEHEIPFVLRDIPIQ